MQHEDTYVQQHNTKVPCSAHLAQPSKSSVHIATTYGRPVTAFHSSPPIRCPGRMAKIDDNAHTLKQSSRDRAVCSQDRRKYARETLLSVLMSCAPLSSLAPMFECRPRVRKSSGKSLSNVSRMRGVGRRRPSSHLTKEEIATRRHVHADNETQRTQ